jgi:hypothetical protein
MSEKYDYVTPDYLRDQIRVQTSIHALEDKANLLHEQQWRDIKQTRRDLGYTWDESFASMAEFESAVVHTSANPAQYLPDPADVVNYYNEKYGAKVNLLAAEINEVTTQYVDGTLQVTVNNILDKSQVKAYCYGARRIPGVKDCELDNAAQFASGYTAFCIVFNPKYARRLEDVRAAARDYTERFLSELQPVTVQAGLFDAVPTQASLF